MNRFEHGDHNIKGKFAAIMFISFQDMYQRVFEGRKSEYKEADAKYKA